MLGRSERALPIQLNGIEVLDARLLRSVTESRDLRFLAGGHIGDQVPLLKDCVAPVAHHVLLCLVERIKSLFPHEIIPIS